MPVAGRSGQDEVSLGLERSFCSGFSECRFGDEGHGHMVWAEMQEKYNLKPFFVLRSRLPTWCR